MDERRRRRVALAILSLVAVTLVAAAAAPLFSTDTDSGGGTGIDQQPDDTPDTGLQLDLPASSIVLVVLVVGLVGLVVQFARDPRETFVGILKMAAVGLVFAGAALLLVENVELTRYAADQEPVQSVGNVSLTEAPTETEPGFGDGSDDTSQLPTGRALLAAVVAGVVGAVTMLVWRSGVVQSALGLQAGAADDDPDASLDAVGRVAGEAADEVEAAPSASAADNAIYAAWTEMVDLLGVPDPQSDTPRAFERAAVEAGLDPEDVTLLTRTFEEVRYGDAALSAERRNQVTDAFRRVERSVPEEAEPHSDEATDGDPPEGRE